MSPRRRGLRPGRPVPQDDARTAAAMITRVGLIILFMTSNLLIGDLRRRGLGDLLQYVYRPRFGGALRNSDE